KLVGGDEKVLSTIEKPSTFFGAKTALHNTLRNELAIATSDTEVWVLSAADLQRLHMAHPNISLHLRAPEMRRSLE
ncbi:MAG: cyclic nucleotide-binding domain-containing protein, partial [Chloroflexota bacterium]